MNMDNIKKFIEDAVSGGWRPNWHWDEKNKNKEEIKEALSDYKDEWYTNYYGMVARVNNPFLDPTAWAAVGKVRGWKRNMVGKFPNQQWEGGPKEKQHQFLDHLQDKLSINDALGKV